MISGYMKKLLLNKHQCKWYPPMRVGETAGRHGTTLEKQVPPYARGGNLRTISGGYSWYMVHPHACGENVRVGG